MTCVDCLHFDICDNKKCNFMTKETIKKDLDFPCSDFKNKADFVEVVRCKDCKHAYFRYNCKDTMQEIYACEKRPAGRMHKKVGADFFCAHGERK